MPILTLLEVKGFIEEARGEIRQIQPACGWQGRILRLILTRLFPYPQRMERLTWVLAHLQRSRLLALARRIGFMSVFPAHIQKLEHHLPIVSRHSARKRLGPRLEAQGQARGKVALLHGCVMNTLFAGATEATAHVLAHNGWEVILPKGQTCCGALHVHEGDRDTGKTLAKRNIAAFEASGAEVYLVNAVGCGSTFKEYGILLEHDSNWAERAVTFSAKVRDVQEFLVETGWQAPAGHFKAQAVYQDACHLVHAQGIRQQPRELLRSVPGLTLKEIPDSDRCCGSAGIYNLTHPEIAEPLLQRKIADVPADIDILITANPGCHLQLASGLA